MAFFFLFRYGFFHIQMCTSLFVQFSNRIRKINQRLVIHRYCDQHNIDKKMRALAIKNSDELWLRKYWYRDFLINFLEIPKYLVVSTLLDDCWEAMKHSEIFCELPIKIKRALCQGMKFQVKLAKGKPLLVNLIYCCPF